MNKYMVSYVEKPTKIPGKRCRRCGEIKPLSEFTKDRARLDGLKRECKECNARFRATMNVNRARREGCEGEFTGEEWLELCAQFDNCCAYCGTTEDITIDHIVPLALHGDNTVENIQPLCRPCNSRKKRKTTDYRNKERKRSA